MPSRKASGRQMDGSLSIWIAILSVVGILLAYYLQHTDNSQLGTLDVSSSSSRVTEGFSEDRSLNTTLRNINQGVKSGNLDIKQISDEVSDYVIASSGVDESDAKLLKNMMDRQIKKSIRPSPRSEPIRYRYDDNDSDGFEEVERIRIDRIIQDEKGWRSLGWNFERTDGNPNYFSFGMGGGASNEPGEVDVVLHRKTREEMEELFPQAHLKGLSVTDFGSRPMHIYFDAQNWASVPNGFEGDQEMYHQYLVQHEMGHILGYQHQLPDGSRGELEVDGNGKVIGRDKIKGSIDKNCPVMFQQSRGTKEWCRANPWVSKESKK